MNDDDDPFVREMEEKIRGDDFLANEVERHMAAYRSVFNGLTFRVCRAVLIEMLTQHPSYVQMVSAVRPRPFLVHSEELAVGEDAGQGDIPKKPGASSQ